MDQDVTGGLPLPLKAPLKSLGFNCSIRQPSADFLPWTLLQLPDWCKPVKNAGNDGVDLSTVLSGAVNSGESLRADRNASMSSDFSLR